MRTQIKSRPLSSKALLLTVLCLLFSINLSFAQSGWNSVYYDTLTAWHGLYFTNPNTGYAAGIKYISDISYPRIIKTTNAGLNWYEQMTTFSDSGGLGFRYIHFINANTGFITVADISSNETRGGILRTTNGGNNWSIVFYEMIRHMTNIFFINSSVGYASGYRTIMKTTNAGITWSTVFQDPAVGYLFAIHFTDVNTGYVVGNWGRILKTTDGGNNWKSTHPASIHLWGLSFQDANTGIAVGGNENNTDNIILRTTDAGNNWDSISYTDTTAILWSVKFLTPFSPSTGFITGFHQQVLKTTNSGLTWVKHNLPILANTFYNVRSCFFTSADTGYLAGGYGYIFKTTTCGTGIKTLSNEVPKKYMLHQNYPNPFNPVTNIKWQIAKVGFTKIIVFDILGKEVATLVNEKLQPGSYEVTFDGSSLSSGVYFYKLTANNFSATKKLILLK